MGLPLPSATFGDRFWSMGHGQGAARVSDRALNLPAILKTDMGQPVLEDLGPALCWSSAPSRHATLKRDEVPAYRKLKPAEAHCRAPALPDHVAFHPVRNPHGSAGRLCGFDAA